MKHLEHAILFLILGLVFGFIFGYCVCKAKIKITEEIHEFNDSTIYTRYETIGTTATEPTRDNPTEGTLFTYRETTLITENEG